MSPRISFSNDFIDTQQTIKHEHNSSREVPVASEHFEFSVNRYTMMPADELFFKGALLPFKKTTLRDELLVDHEEDDVSVRPPKVPTKWKEFLGLKKSHILYKKPEKSEEPTERVVGVNGSKSIHQENHISKISQVPLANKESMFGEVEMLI
ncbi:hypothetical protein IFM89_038137 [Coptis chinensis]|uniref:Uncharacterized protein n=1 Tax=Coptis chinensis TaxID=261450 RepID=A0A835LUK1_9MAGN|nr:hypothetical protein IFM89_038137 [Coptis chinensis]